MGLIVNFIPHFNTFTIFAQFYLKLVSLECVSMLYGYIFYGLLTFYDILTMTVVKEFIIHKLLL